MGQWPDGTTWESTSQRKTTKIPTFKSRSTTTTAATAATWHAKQPPTYCLVPGGGTNEKQQARASGRQRAVHGAGGDARSSRISNNRRWIKMARSDAKAGRTKCIVVSRAIMKSRMISHSSAVTISGGIISRHTATRLAYRLPRWDLRAHGSWFSDSGPSRSASRSSISRSSGHMESGNCKSDLTQNRMRQTTPAVKISAFCAAGVGAPPGALFTYTSAMNLIGLSSSMWLPQPHVLTSATAE
mmetsp:Transcript_32872/g.99281  ORF Transcript_32872/g.99281 Transcript_32872/m.99281 type:complete len:243 (+) Transcript_32872:78-806(+)